MAQTWAMKGPTEIVEREWGVPTLDEDSLASFTASATGVTIDASESNGDVVTLTLSSGTVDTTATVDITATTKNGLVIAERFYLPIRPVENALAETARDVCNFALRKVAGVAETADAAELDDALEQMTDLLAGWAAEGADLQVKLPCEANDELTVPDWAVGAIKANLRAKLHDFYGVDLTRDDMLAAQRGVQRVKMRLLPDEREGVEFY